MAQKKSEKSRLAALLLCLFLGTFGVHRFYVGKVGTGLLMLFTIGGLGIWTLIDFIVIAVGSFKDNSGLPIVDWSSNEANATSTADNNISGLEKLAALKDKGHITDDEFAAKKKELLEIRS